MIRNAFAKPYAPRQRDWLLIAAKDGYGTRRNSGWESRRNYPADDA